MADEDWRIEVDLDDEEQGYSLTERLRAADLDEEARARLGERVVVSRDGSRIFLYAATESQSREAEQVIRDLVARHDLSAEISASRWHPVEQTWKDASIPLPTTAESIEEERTSREAAEERDAERAGWTSHVRVELPHRGDAVDLAAELEPEGHKVHRRWRYVTVDLATEDAAQELADRLADSLPEGSELTIETKPPDPVFVFLESRGV
ncbi:MAG TPA: hypothetical protein VHI55_12870 [Gaiellaceae bacterium]|nr:hypothetical protein [Gaiellaceae bacterium]